MLMALLVLKWTELLHYWLFLHYRLPQTIWKLITAEKQVCSVPLSHGRCQQSQLIV